MNSEIKRIAKKIGLIPPGYSNHFSEKDLLSDVAAQLGMEDYDYNDECNKELYARAKDAEQQFDLENDIYDEPLPGEVGAGYDPNFGNKNENDEDNEDNDKDEKDPNSQKNKKDSDNQDGEDDKNGEKSKKPNNENGKNDNDTKNDDKSDTKSGNEDSDKNKETSSSKSNVDNKDSSSGVNTNDVGNGYDPMRMIKTSGEGSNINRETLNHSNRVKAGKAAEENTSSNTTSQKDNKVSKKNDESKKEVSDTSKKPGLGGKLRNTLNKASNAKNAVEHPGEYLKSKVVNGLKNFILHHPLLSIGTLTFIILMLLVLFTSIDADGSNGGSGSGTNCSYDLQGVTSSGSVKLDDIKVELINCDGTQSNYTVLETVDFEKYVVGVAMGEIGPGAPAEAIKSQIIAARNFSLTRNSAMCPGNPDNCFYGYNANTNIIRMRACEADHVYWDYEKDIYRQDRGAISLYSPEVNSGTIWKSALSEEKKAEILAIAEDVKGKVLLDSDGKVVYTNYNSTTSNEFSSGANAGKSYEEILNGVYNTNNYSSASCHSGGGTGNIDYGDYVLSSDGHQLLHQEIGSFLNSKGTSLEEFNALIQSNIDKAGRGTRAGVVAAAVTLIGELGNQYGVKVPYYWGGGHFDGPVIGALNTWGTRKCHTYANGQSYDYCGLDCSGFVSWSLHNGGFDVSARQSGTFSNLSGAKKVSLSNSAVLQAGDILETNGHVVLVVGVDENSKQYICAEASGNQEGVWFTRRPFNNSGYWGVKMDGFYGD